MKKILKFSLIIILMFHISTVNIFLGYSQFEEEESSGLPDIYIDLSPIFEKMSYTDKNITNISKETVMNVLFDYCQKNPFGYTTEKPANFDPENSNFSDYFISDDESGIVVNGPTPLAEKSLNGNMLLTETKACVTCAIWDYPGSQADIGYFESAAEDHLYEHAEDDGDYSIVYTNLENSIATRDNIDTVLEYFFDNYDNVDLYFLGHGGRAWITLPYPYNGFYAYYYCPYDAIDADTGYAILSNVFWDSQLDSTNPLWDSSPMRMVMFVACRDWEFYDEALSPGGSTSHARAFCGFNGVAYNQYAYYFVLKWCDLWYESGWDSSSAAATAREYAWGYNQDGVNMSYADTGTSIYC